MQHLMLQGGIMGKGYIVGAGPGDIGLITKKGYDLLEKADVILYDRLVDQRILNNVKKNCKLIYVGKSSTTGGETQKWINEVFVKETKENEITLRLHGGDPFLFGRGSEEIDELVKEGLEYEVVPGISSSFAVASYAGIPVTKRDISSSLHIFTARSGGGDIGLDFSTIAKLRGTIVILMGVGVIEDITKNLIAEGMSGSTEVSVIQEGTTANQRAIKGTLENISSLVIKNDIKAPSIIIIGGTAQLLGAYDWFTKQKLFGKRVLITRDRDSFDKSAKIFEEIGAETIALPMIELQTDFSVLTSEFYEGLKKYEFVSFNSPKAVTSFFEGAKAQNFDSRVLGNNKIIVMGSGTKEELSKYNLKPDFIPKEYSVLSLLSELKETFGIGKKLLLLSSDIHGRDEVSLSKEYSLDITIKSIYNNKSVSYSKEELEKSLKPNDYLIFLSSSAVESFIINTKELDVSKYKFVSIGPTTSKSIASFGLPVHVEAKVYSLQGIRDAVIESLEK